MTESIEIELTLNGKPRKIVVEPRDSLSDVLRDRLDLTGTHIGCDHGACGACTVRLDDVPVRSCLILAVRCDRRNVVTIEGTAREDRMNVIRRHFHEKHALQCGFCTPGMLMMASDIIERHGQPTEGQVRASLSGQICRCTGYVGIVSAIMSAAEELQVPGPA